MELHYTIILASIYVFHKQQLPLHFPPHFALKKGFTWTFYLGGKCVAEMKFVIHPILAVLAGPIADSKARGCIIFSRNVRVKPISTNSALPPSFFSFSFRSLHNYPFFSQRDEYWISGVATYISSAVAASTWNLIICRVSGHTYFLKKVNQFYLL